MTLNAQHLTPEQSRIYRESVADGAPRSTRARILTLDHEVTAEWDDRLISGTTVGSKVAFRDVGNLTSQVFTGSFTNPDRKVVWGPELNTKYALWPNDLMQLIDTWDVPGLGLVEEEISIGVIRRFRDADGAFEVATRGKEWLAQRELGENREWREGTKVTKVMRDLMKATGETFFDIADVKAVLHHDLVVDAHANVWRVVQRLARGRDLQAFYPGNGRFTVRRLPGNVSLVWSTGEGGLIDGEPATEFNMPDDFHNVFARTGKRPHGGARRPRGNWQPAPTHDLAPAAFKRGGVPGRFVDRRTNPKWGTDRECDRVAKRAGTDALRLTEGVDFAAIPVGGWLLGDTHAVVDLTYGRRRFRVGSYSWPHGNDSGQLTINRVTRS